MMGQSWSFRLVSGRQASQQSLRPTRHSEQWSFPSLYGRTNPTVSAMHQLTALRAEKTLKKHISILVLKKSHHLPFKMPSPRPVQLDDLYSFSDQARLWFCSQWRCSVRACGAGPLPRRRGHSITWWRSMTSGILAEVLRPIAPFVVRPGAPS